MDQPKEEKKRFRRTLLQIETDNQRAHDGLPSIDWENETKEQWENHYKDYNQKQKGDAGMKVETAEDDQEETEKKVEEQLDKNRIPVEQLAELQKQITDVMVKQLKVEAKQIIKDVTTAVVPQKVVVSFKVNEKELVDKISDPHPLLAKLVNLLKSGTNVLLVGPAGSGKTMLGDQASKVLGLQFGHLCFSAGVSETWLYGRQLPTGFVEQEFSKLYREGGVFLADEMDAADANLLLSINTALANGVMYNPISGEKHTRHKDFHFIGAANTFGKGQNSAYAGRNRLDAATLDRFVSIPVDYLPEIEEKICPVRELLDSLRALREVIKKANGSDVISYRAFSKGMVLYNLGYDVKEIKEVITASWTKELKATAGIN